MFKKFRKWINFNPPYALDADGWDEFNTKFRKEAPIRYFMDKVVARAFRRVGYKIANVVDWLRYRTVARNHIVKTGLEPGYNDVPEKLLYTSFTMLVDFVECEKAWMQIAFEKELFRKHMGWKRHLPRALRPPFRNRELGLEYLDWEATLDDDNVNPHERSPEQARTSRKIKQLYLWWTEERAKREELPYPLDDDDRPEGVLGTLSTKWKAENPEMEEAVREWGRKSNMEEEAWNAEDTVMLCELVKLRRNLWT